MSPIPDAYLSLPTGTKVEHMSGGPLAPHLVRITLPDGRSAQAEESHFIVARERAAKELLPDD